MVGRRSSLYARFPSLLGLAFTLAPLVCGNYDGSSLDSDLTISIKHTPCTRLFTTTSSMGCRSPGHDGARGALFQIRDSSDIITATKTSTLEKLEHGWMAVIDLRFLNLSTLLMLDQGLGDLRGVIVLPSAVEEAIESGAYDPDTQSPQGNGTPQSALTLNSSYPWNPSGDGLLYHDLSFPVAYADASEGAQILSWCKHNRERGYNSWPLYYAEITAYMGPSEMTSQRCLEWTDRDGTLDPQCLPLGGQSVWATVEPLDRRPKVFLTAGMDSTSPFHYDSFGVNDAVTSIITVLAAADILARSNTSGLASQISFLLAQSEEFGYAGSRRFVRDVQSFTCANGPSIGPTGEPMCLAPLYPSTLFANLTWGAEDMPYVLAVDQLLGSDSAKFYVHSLPSSRSAAESVVAALQTAMNITVEESSVDALPPSPLTSFLTFSPSSSPTSKSVSAPFGLVISGYDSHFSDARYHTQFDNSSVRSTADLTKLVEQASTAASLALYTLAGGYNPSGLARPNSTLIQTLVECMTSSWACEFMDQFARSEQANLKAYLGGSVSFLINRGGADGAGAPYYYTDVIYATGGRLPVVQHTPVHGSPQVYTRYEEREYDSARDLVYVLPNQLEVFVRAFLSHTLSLGSGRDSDAGSNCTTSKDCGVCGVRSIQFNTTMECILGVCVCACAHYHLALDPGIEPLSTPNHFTVSDASSPSFTEPYWSTPTLSVYLHMGNTQGYAALGVGLLVLISSAAGAMVCANLLSKQKVL